MDSHMPRLRNHLRRLGMHIGYFATQVIMRNNMIIITYIDFHHDHYKNEFDFCYEQSHDIDSSA